MKLMIVDDHAGARETIRQALDLPGVTVCECACGEEAIWLADVFKPDWVTMDIRMPGLDGIKTTKLLRSKLPKAQVVVVSNDDSLQIRDAALNAGAVGFFLKENFAGIRSLLTGNATATTKSDAKVAIGHGESPVLRVLMIEDCQVDYELISRHLIRCGYRPAVECVDREETMRAALERSHWDVIFMDHGLPGFSAAEALGLVHKLRPEIPILCITGSNNPSVIKQILDGGARVCINKDDLSPLCAALKRVLATTSHGFPNADENTDRQAKGSS